MQDYTVRVHGLLRLRTAEGAGIHDIAIEEEVREQRAGGCRFRHRVEGMRRAGKRVQLGRDTGVAQELHEPLAAFEWNGGIGDAMKQHGRRRGFRHVRRG